MTDPTDAIRRVLSVAGHQRSSDLVADVALALRSEASLGYAAGRTVALTAVADVFGMERVGGDLDDLERKVLDAVREAKP